MIYNAYQDTNKDLFGFSVVSAGHIFAHPGRTVFRPNGRADHLLFYVAKGSEHLFLDHEVELQEGSFVFFRPYEKQMHVQRSSKISEFYFIHFNAPAEFDLFGFESSVAYINNPSTKIRDMFEEIINELQSKEPEYENICASKLFNIILLLKRKYKKSSGLLGQYTDKISFIIQKMNKEYYENYSLEDYAKICCISKYHFSRVFKNITGYAPIEYRNNIRLEHAKDMLSDTESSINEISRNVGYANSAYFCNVFKNAFGVSPGEYRKRYR